MPKTDTADPKPDAPAEKPQPKDVIVETKHSTTLGGTIINYTALCGTIVLTEESEKAGEGDGEFEGHKPRAEFFFVAYLRDGVDDPRARPITFSFNGGPGSASVWLHLGLLGPKRVEMGDADGLLPPPYRLVDNDHSLLDATDLVFIDPVGTGFSRPVAGEKAKRFHSLKRDIESVGDFIRLFCSRYGRWPSPKFLIGESYGTTRAAGLAGYLQERHGLYLNGVMLVSVVLDFSTLRYHVGNDLPFTLSLPSFTATAWYHKRLDADLQQNLRRALEQAENFALNEYSVALLKGATLSADERASVAQKLARFTGLSQDFVERADLRVTNSRFFKELLREQGKTVGRLDSRFTGVDRDNAGEHNEFDPSLAAISGPYASTLNDYVRRELKFESDVAYEVLSGKVNRQWRFDEHENQYVNVAETLRTAMTANPHLKVLVANGYYDLATVYFATEYTFNHLGLPEALRANVTMTYYEAGHMMYVHMPSLSRLSQDLANFVAGAQPAQT